MSYDMLGSPGDNDRLGIAVDFMTKYHNGTLDDYLVLNFLGKLGPARDIKGLALCTEFLLRLQHGGPAALVRAKQFLRRTLVPIYVGNGCTGEFLLSLKQGGNYWGGIKEFACSDSFRTEATPRWVDLHLLDLSGDRRSGSVRSCLANMGFELPTEEDALFLATVWHLPTGREYVCLLPKSDDGQHRPSAIVLYLDASIGMVCEKEIRWDKSFWFVGRKVVEHPTES